MGFVHHGAEIVQGAKQRVDVAIIAYIVAKVFHGTFENGRQPHGICPQFGDIVQVLGDAWQVADPIAIAVCK